MWSMYWRYLLSLTVLLVVANLVFYQSGLLYGFSHVVLEPTMVWAAFALVCWLVRLGQKNGLVYMFFGRYAKCADVLWQRFNLALMLLFVGLALLNYALYWLFGEDVWKVYKLFGSSTLVLLVPLLVAYRLNRN